MVSPQNSMIIFAISTLFVNSADSAPDVPKRRNLATKFMTNSTDTTNGPAAIDDGIGISILAKAGLRSFFSTAKSEYFLSIDKTDARTARETCEDLSGRTGRDYHLLVLENPDELNQIKKQLRVLESDDEFIWTAGERDKTSKIFWNVPNNTRPLIQRDFLQFDDGMITTTTEMMTPEDTLVSLPPPPLSRKARRSVRASKNFISRMVTVPYGDRYIEGESDRDTDCENGLLLSPECQMINCNVTLPECSFDNGIKPKCESEEEPKCDVIRPKCTAKCENCTIVVPPQCFVQPQNCTVTQGECAAIPQKCQVEHPPCSVTRPPCESYRLPCQNVSVDAPCSTEEPCIDDCGKENDCGNSDCKDCKCKVKICRVNETICPPPITHCPLPIVTCPDPIVNCTDKPIIECPEPIVDCPEPKVTCTQAQVACSAPIVNCPPLVTSCTRPPVKCETPSPNCPPPEVTCDETPPCPLGPASPKPCDDCPSCGCVCVDGRSTGLNFQRCKRKHRFVCEAPRT